MALIYFFLVYSSYLDADTDVLLAWVSYINMSILIGTLAVALFNASKDPVARNFAYVYAIISVGILVCAECSHALKNFPLYSPSRILSIRLSIIVFR